MREQSRVASTAGCDVRAMAMHGTAMNARAEGAKVTSTSTMHRMTAAMPTAATAVTTTTVR